MKIWKLICYNVRIKLLFFQKSVLEERKMYGQYFKRLRNYKKMTLGEAAKDITSSPALSRWENGVDDIRLKKFLALLDRVDITPRGKLR